jgi:hypothetical protein
MSGRVWAGLGLTVTAAALVAADDASSTWLDFKGAGVVLAVPGVDQEIKLTDDQAAKLRPVAAEVKKRYDAAMKAADKAKGPAQAPLKLKAFRDAIALENTRLRKTLKRDQFERLQQINRQLNPMGAVIDPETTAPLGLDIKQQQKLLQMLPDVVDKLASLRADLGPDAAKNKATLANIKKEQDAFANQFVRLLKDPQKKLWNDKLVGKLFVPADPAAKK